MRIHIEPTLYFDPQQALSAVCPVCGSTVYFPGLRCIRCERGRLL